MLLSPAGNLGEIEAQRTLTGKVWDMGKTSDNRQKKSQKIQCGEPVHVPSDFTLFNSLVTVREDIKQYRGGWDDCDCDLVLDNGVYRTGNTYYDLEIDPAVYGYKYVSKRRGDCEVKLDRITGSPPGPMPTPRVVGNKIFWDEVRPGLDLMIVCKAMGVAIFKIVKTPTAPKAFRWEIREGDMSGLTLKKQTAGIDNADLAISRRPEHDRRPLEIIVTESAPITVGGKKVYTVTEIATGKVFRRDPITRERTLSTDIVYPIRIDQDITETIQADGDDGYQDNDTGVWATEYGSSGNTIMDDGANLGPGFRYLGILVGQGDTIDTGTLLRVEVGQHGDSQPTTGTLFGDDVDDAAAFANDDGPYEFTNTTASFAVSIAESDQNTQVTWDLFGGGTGIVQEIVDRGSWASNNDMRFGVVSVTTYYAYLGDSSAGGDIAVILEINFTASAGLSIPVAMSQYRRQHLNPW